MQSTSVEDLGGKQNLTQKELTDNTPVNPVEAGTALIQETKEAIIFDVDGTLTDPEHRTHYIRIKPRNWPAFYKLMPKDPEVESVCHIVRSLYEMYRDKYAIIIVTARPEDYKVETEEWLKRHGIKYDAIFMRESKDNRDDTITKKEMLDKARELGYKPVIAFDDRPKVIRMYAREGILCMSCGDINKEF
jgi:uncharacterized HAD superfamily protein